MSKASIDAAAQAAMEVEAPTPKKTEFTTRILSIYANKGGVGKTTAALNIAAELAHMGVRVGLIDCDSQCNSTKSFVKYKINFDRDFCPYMNEEHRRLIREELTSRIVNGRSFDNNFEPHTGIHIRLTETHTLEEIQSLLYKTKDRGLRTALFLDENKEPHFAFLQQTSTKRCDFLHNEATREIGNALTDEKEPQNITEIFTLDRWKAIESGEACPTDRERRQLIFFALACTAGAKSKKHINYAVNEIIYCLNDFEVLTEPEEEKKKSYKQAYIIKGDDEDWTITHSKRAYPYTESNRLEETYDAPTIIDNYREKHAKCAASGITTIDKKEIKQRLCSHRVSNIFTLLGDQTGSTRQILLSAARSASLIEAMPPRDEGTDADGVVMLLPGNRLFHLNLEEQASRAISGLTRKDRLTGEPRPEIPREVAYITESRLKLTELARNNHLDFLILDLNPSISRINQLFITISDGILTPYNLQEYNDDAVEGFCHLIKRVSDGRRVLFSRLSRAHHKQLEINQDFKKLKLMAPKFLGSFYQKYPKRLKRIHKDYMASIENKINKHLIPLLIEQDMYPLNGIHGYDSTGKRYDSTGARPKTKKALAIRAFVQDIEQCHKEGMPVSWIEKTSKNKKQVTQAKPVQCSVQNVISHTIGDHAVSNLHFTNPPVRKLFEKHGNSMSIESTKTFLIESCIMTHSEWRKSCHHSPMRDHIHIAHPLYRLDDIDMHLGLCANIHAQLGNRNYRLGILCGSTETPILYFEKPCHFRRVNAQFQHCFRVEFYRLHDSIWDHKSQNLNILVTFFDGTNWHTAEFRLNPPKHAELDIQMSVRINQTTAARNQKLSSDIKDMIIDLSNAICSIINEKCGITVRQPRQDDHPTVVNCSQFYQNNLDTGIIALLHAKNFISSTMGQPTLAIPLAPKNHAGNKRKPPILRCKTLSRRRQEIIAGIEGIYRDELIGASLIKDAYALSESARKEQLHFSKYEEDYIADQLSRCVDSSYTSLRKEWGSSPNALHVAGFIALCVWQSNIPMSGPQKSEFKYALIRKSLAQIAEEKSTHLMEMTAQPAPAISSSSILTGKKKANMMQAATHKKARKN